MKTNNIFDYLEGEGTINNDSIIENTGVNTENVLNIVKRKLTAEDGRGKIKPIRKTARRVFTILAAAVVATAVTAQAMGSFKDVFGDFLIGESPDGIYSGDNLSIESETSNVEFLGIAGDTNTAVASMRVKKNDGSAYIDDIENTWISSSASGEVDNTFYGDIIGEEIRFTRSTWSEVTDRDPILSCFGLYFEDNSTINAYILSDANEGGIKGETMTAEIGGLSAYTCKEILYDFSEHYNENTDDEGYYSNENFYEKLVELVKEYGTNEKDGKRLMVNPETKDIVLAEETPLDVEFKLSVKMNYRTSSRKLDAENLSGIYSESCTATLNIQPFTLSFEVDTAENKIATPSDPSLRPRFPDSLEITLDDGSIITGYWQSTTNVNDDAYTMIYRYYNNKRDGSRFFPISINPNSVISVEANDVKIYG